MEGRRHVAIEAARKASSKIPGGAWREVPLFHQFLVAPLFAYTRFEEWGLILEEPRPAKDSLFWTGVWHYARGLAFTAREKLDEATQKLDRLQRIAAQKSLDDYRVTFSRNGAKEILEIATEVLAGGLAAARRLRHCHRQTSPRDSVRRQPDLQRTTPMSLGKF